MSDYYQLNFDFGLDPYGPDAWPRVFLALARGHLPESADLAALPALVSRYLGSGDWFPVKDRVETVGSLVRMTRHSENPHLARNPVWTVQFSICMHDDEYMNRGYGLFAAIADMVGHNGLFCTEILSGHAGRVVHYYREQDDLLIVKLDAPPPYGLIGPDSKKTLQEALPSFKPATEASFSVGKVYRISADERRSWYAES